MWMFEKKGIVTIADGSTVKDRDAFDLAVIDAGAEDITRDADLLQVVSEVRDLQRVASAVERLGIKPDGIGIEYIAKTTTAADDPTVRQQLEAFVEALEDLDDVDAVYTN